MRIHFSVRSLLYGVAAAALATLAVAALIVYVNGLNIPAVVLNSRLLQGVASRYGMHYRLGSLQIGCLTEKCAGAVRASALEFEIATPEPFRVHLNELHSTRNGPVTVRGLELGIAGRPAVVRQMPFVTADSVEVDPSTFHFVVSDLRIGMLPSSPPAEIARVEFDVSAKRVSASGIRIRSEVRPPVDVDEIRIEGWTSSMPVGGIVLDRIDVHGVALNLMPSLSSGKICDQLPAAAVLGRQAVAPFRPVLPLLLEGILKLRGDLFRIAIILAAAIFVFKFLSLLWLRRWPIQLALAAVPASAPFALYFYFRNSLSIRSLTLLLIAALILLALACQVFVYQRSAKWYHRWEPFAVDLASIAILFPLLAYGYELPVLPTYPSGLRIDRIQVENIGGQVSGTLRFNVPQTSIRGVRVSLPGANIPSVDLAVSSVQIQNIALSTADDSRLSIDAMTADNIMARYDPNQLEIEDLSAHVQFGGLVESEVLWRELKKIEFLRSIGSRTDRVAFNVDLRIAGPDVSRITVQQPSEKHVPIALNVGVTLNPVECSASYDVEAGIRTSPLLLAVRADGDASGVRIRTLHSLPGSDIQIGSGNGTVLWSGAPSGRLNLERVGGAFGSSELLVDSIDVSAVLPSIRKTGLQSAFIAVGPTSIQFPDGWKLQLHKTNLSFRRMPDVASVPVEIQSRIENVHLEHRGEEAIDADFPLLEATVSGKTTPEAIPNRFFGALAFRASGNDPSDEVAGTDQPILVTADLWKGRFDVPEQAVILRETFLSKTPTELPVRIELSGQLSSVSPELSTNIKAEADISRFEQILGSTQIAFNDFRVVGSLDVKDGRTSARVSYNTAWNSVELPSVPSSALCLDEISTLDVTSSGSISRMTQPGSLMPAGVRMPSTCLSLPSTSAELRMRVSGVYPPGPGEYAIQWERENGRGIRIQSLSSQIQSMRIQGGRMGDIQTQVNVVGIQNLQGGGGLNVRAELLQTRNLMRIQTGLAAAQDGTPLIELELTSTPSRMVLDVSQHVSADRILTPLNPFLSDFDIDLRGIHPHARLAQFHAEANFDGRGLLDAAATLRLDGGILATADSAVLPSGMQWSVASAPGNPGPILNLSVGRPAASIGPRTILVAIDVPATDIHARMGPTDPNLIIDMNTSFNFAAQASLFSVGQPTSRPVADHIFEVGAGLSHQAPLFAEFVGLDNTLPVFNNVHWTQHLSQTLAAKPFLRVAPNEVRLNIESSSFNADWSDDDNGVVDESRSRVGASMALDSIVSLADGQLLLDAFAPLEFSYAANGLPETRIQSSLPIQVAFAGRLKESTANGNSLWSSEYYSKFWSEHPSPYSGKSFVSPIDVGEVLFGPLSFRQIRFPIEPLRVTIGYSDAFQIGLPISAHALFGNVEGMLESNVAISKISELTSRALVDARLNMELKNIQVGALTTTMGGGRSAIVEDELDGKVSLRLDGLVVDSHTLPALMDGTISANQLEKVGISVHLFRSPESLNLRGFLQASSDVQINLVNEVLNRIMQDVRLPAPPQAMSYSSFAFDFDVDRGMVKTDHQILKVDGLKLFSSNFFDVPGRVRTHLGRPGERILLGSVLEMLGGITVVKAPGER